MESFRNIMESYGVDYDDTLRRFLNNESFYFKILSMFPKDGSLEKLSAAIANGNLEEAFEAAHTLKGVAGNLGLTPLFNAVCTIVESLRMGTHTDEYPQMLAAISDEYKRALELCALLPQAGQ